MAPPGTLEFIVQALSEVVGPIREPEATLNERGRSVSLHLHSATVDAACTGLFGDEVRTPVWVSVEQYPDPEPWEDDSSQRWCGACGALVPTLAVCQVCGFEEDAAQWTLGPNKILFRRSIGIAVCLQGGPAVVTMPRPELDHRLRQFLAGALERIEAHLKCTLRLVPVTVA